MKDFTAATCSRFRRMAATRPNRTPGRKDVSELAILAGARSNSVHGVCWRRKRDF